ncbi:phosphatase PAP2 family protein [Micromonospora sp. NPDC005806]|uniref:phosphatase PAP2 family protein n=1 Tax=Micromonospora sp. NPDC005806 TaxID=3364234 RepID=UPI0036CA8287
MGFARVWTGVHYPADIVAGAVIGVVAVLITAFGRRAFDRWSHRRGSGTAVGSR